MIKGKKNNMPEKDPTTWNAATWSLSIIMGMSGGLVNWYARMKRQNSRAFSILELIGETFTSGFVGVCSFMFLISVDQPMVLCAAAAGVSGSMATRLLSAVEKVILNKVESK